MNRIWCLLLGLALACAVDARDYSAGNLDIGDPWAVPPPPGAPSVAGYMSITNSGAQDDRLLGAETARAERVELHETRIDGDVARMRKLDDGLLVPAGATVMLEPNGAHLMLFDAGPLTKGEYLAVTLVFERQGPVNVEILIDRPDGASHVPAMDHGAMEHEGMDHEGMDHEGMDHEGMDHEVGADHSTH